MVETKTSDLLSCISLDHYSNTISDEFKHKLNQKVNSNIISLYMI